MHCSVMQLVTFKRFSCWPADEDECRTPLITCGLWADCINTPGSYKCVCHSGYKHEYGKCVGKCGQITQTILETESFAWLFQVVTIV